MSNSDYLIKATMKKISERLNKTFIEKIEEAANAAQEVPETIMQEIENLKEEIYLEAKRLEEIDSENQNMNCSKSTIDQSISKINNIKIYLEKLNDLLDE